MENQLQTFDQGLYFGVAPDMVVRAHMFSSSLVRPSLNPVTITTKTMSTILVLDMQEVVLAATTTDLVMRYIDSQILKSC